MGIRYPAIAASMLWTQPDSAAGDASRVIMLMA
jgi:hypothetical protein